MQRTTIGIISLVLLFSAGILWLGGWNSETAGWMSASLRVGLVMALLWLAEPQLRRFPAWALPAVGAVLVLALLFRQRPIHFLAALAILLAAYVARPRSMRGRR